MPEQIHLPYGNAFLVGTPNIDRLSQMLYAENRQKQALRQKQAEDMDADFRKNILSIRDIDKDEFVKKYSDYKKTAFELMRKKEHDPQKRIDMELEKQRKLADMYGFTNESKAHKDQEDEIAKQIIAKPDLFDDNASTLLMNSRRTPLAGLSQYKSRNAEGQENTYDLRNPETYRYKGSDTDFQKIFTTASGTPRQVYQSEENVDGGLQTKVTPYVFGNTPAQYYESLLGALSERNAKRSAEALISHVPDETIATINNLYKSAPKDKWEKIGVKEPQDLEIYSNDPPTIKFAKHQAQLYFLNNEPKAEKQYMMENKSAVMKAQEAKERRMEALRHSNAEELIEYKAKIDPSDTKTTNVWVDSYINAITKDAKEGQKFQLKTTDGKQYEGYKIQVDPVMAKALGIDAKNAGELLVTDDGKFIQTFYETDANYNPVVKGGKGAMLPHATKELSQDQVKLALGYRAVSPTQRTKEMTTHQPGTQTKPTNKVEELPAGTIAEWKANGWNDSQIKQAVKDGKIKVTK